MSPISIGILAVSMSADAFVASLGRGAAGGSRPGFAQALRTGAVFGAVEAVTPLIGWLLGVAASQYVAAVDHWIAFVLLGAVGLRMVLQAMGRHEDEVASPSTWALLATAIGTSIDAMVVGMSLAFLEVNIFIIALAIGAATMALSTTGILAGRFLGRALGQLVEICGGIALIGLGTMILVEHLTV